MDKLDGKTTEECWQAKSTEWRKEQDTIQDQLARHQWANHHYFEQGLKIFELAQVGLRQYDAKSEEERRNLLAFVLSNCTMNGVTLTPTYRKPFCWIAEGPLSAIWRGRRGYFRTTGGAPDDEWTRFVAEFRSWCMSQEAHLLHERLPTLT